MDYRALSPTDKFIHNTLTIHKLFKLSRRSSIYSNLVNYAMCLNKDLEALVFYIPTLTFCVDYEDKMAKTRPDFNLIDYRLSEAELDGFDAWMEKHPITVSECLSELAQRDYKCSFTFVENSEAWCISITGKEEAKFNSKSTLTTWGDEPIEALAMAVYKAGVVFSWGVWKTKTQSKRG